MANQTNSTLFADDFGAGRSIADMTLDSMVAHVRFVLDGSLEGFALNLYPNGTCDEAALRHFGFIE